MCHTHECAYVCIGRRVGMRAGECASAYRHPSIRAYTHNRLYMALGGIRATTKPRKQANLEAPERPDARTRNDSNTNPSPCAGMHPCNHAFMQRRIHASTERCNRTNIQIRKRATEQTFRYANTPMPIHAYTRIRPHTHSRVTTHMPMRICICI